MSAIAWQTISPLDTQPSVPGVPTSEKVCPNAPWAPGEGLLTAADVAAHHLGPLPAGGAGHVATAFVPERRRRRRERGPGARLPPPRLQRERPQRPSRHLSGDPSGARLRGLLRVGRLPVQVLRAGRLQLHPQRHVGVQLLHHRRGGQGQSALGVSRGAQPRRLGDGDGQSLPLRHVPRVPLLSRRRTASALLAKPSPSKNVKYSRVKIGLSWRHGRWRTSNHLPGRRSAAGHEFALHAAPV
ncbi:glycoprotein hormone alpha-2 isoform X1 [Stigmatopora argus]